MMSACEPLTLHVDARVVPIDRTLNEQIYPPLQSPQGSMNRRCWLCP